MSEPTNEELLAICASAIGVDPSEGDWTDRMGFDALRAVFAAGRLAAMGEGIECYVIMRIGFGGKPEEPSPWKTRFWYPHDKRLADSEAFNAYVEDVEVRPARLVVMRPERGSGGSNG